MTVREYIGARYVPLFMGEWNIENSYEPLSIVSYQGNSYTSRQAVPSGIQITNNNYWALTGNYNAQIEQYRQEVQNISDELPSSEFDSENTVKDYIDDKNKEKMNVLVAALTNENNTDSYVGVSIDGFCFTPIEGTKDILPKTDVAFFKYQDKYLFAATGNPITLGYTEDFVTFHQYRNNLGFTEYRNTNYPAAASSTKYWTPRFYLDENNKVNILVSMAIGEDMESIDDVVRERMGCFRQEVEFDFTNENFVVPKGDISRFIVYEDGQEVETLFDCDVIVRNGMFYFGYKNGYYNDVNIARGNSATSTLTCISKNIFKLPFTEAISFLKTDDENVYIYGQKYHGANSRFYSGTFNLLINTKNFLEFEAIGVPNRSDIPDNVLKMRNLSPIKIDSELGGKLLERVSVIGTGIREANLFSTGITNPTRTDMFNEYHSAGRTFAPFGNFYATIEDRTILSGNILYMCNFWNSKNIDFGMATDNKPRGFQVNFVDSDTHRNIVVKSGTTRLDIAVAQPRVIDAIQQSSDTFNAVYNEETSDEVVIKTTNSYLCYLRGNINKDAVAGEPLYELKIRPAYNNYAILGFTRPGGTVIPFLLGNTDHGCTLTPLVSTTENIRIDTVVYMQSNSYSYLD